MASPASLHYEIWKACAGGSARVPAVGSLIYYFPQGHVEHAFSMPDFSSLLLSPPPMFLCQVTAVSLNAHPSSDEVYAKFLLNPIDAASIAHAPSLPPPEGGISIKSDAKVLTLSDANNGGGFTVPRSCAVSVFPSLTYDVQTPEQEFLVRDMHGVPWEFKHIYRGTPRRHLLTTGWSKFVNNKKLIAGDTLVFIRHPSGQLFVGIRRVCRTCSGPISYAEMKDNRGPHTDDGDDEEDSACNFSRTTRCRVSGRSVLEAVQSAVEGRPFEVLYYPKIGWPEFVVAKELVDEALAVWWEPGIRIKMAMMDQMGCSTAMSHEGKVSCVAAVSPWRMLEVNWENPGIMKNVKTVNPWEVELVSSNSLYVYAKRLKLLHPEFGGSYLGGLTSSLMFDLNGSSSGIQEPRHVPSNLATNFVPKSTNQELCIDKLSSDMPRLDEGRIIHGQGRVQFGTTSACSATRKPRKETLMLFGVEINPIPKAGPNDSNKAVIDEENDYDDRPKEKNDDDVQIYQAS